MDDLPLLVRTTREFTQSEKETLKERESSTEGVVSFRHLIAFLM